MNLHVIQRVLDARQLDDLRARLLAAPWQDGRASAGAQAQRVKRNLQLAPDSEEEKALAELVRQRVANHETFRQLALPRKLTTPLFSRYQDGMEYGAHTDDGYYGRGQVRTDLAATLFLSELDTYDGGELVVQGSHVRLAAGDMVLYPASTVHRVAAVTRGVRLAAVLWIQSLIRSTEQRELVVSLGEAIKALPAGPATLAVSAAHQNLVRMWAES